MGRAKENPPHHHKRPKDRRACECADSAERCVRTVSRAERPSRIFVLVHRHRQGTKRGHIGSMTCGRCFVRRLCRRPPAPIARHGGRGMAPGGILLEEVAKLLVHESVKTTEKHSSAWIKGRQDRLDSLVIASWKAVKARKKSRRENT